MKLVDRDYFQAGERVLVHDGTDVALGKVTKITQRRINVQITRILCGHFPTKKWWNTLGSPPSHCSVKKMTARNLKKARADLNMELEAEKRFLRDQMEELADTRKIIRDTSKARTILYDLFMKAVD